MPASKADIQTFLADVRNGIDAGKFVPICRKKNMDTLAILGISWSDAKSEIYGLTAANYISGPEIDRDRPTTDNLWKFKKDVLNHIIYIKLKVEYQVDGRVKVVSFHIDGA